MSQAAAMSCLGTADLKHRQYSKHMASASVAAVYIASLPARSAQIYVASDTTETVSYIIVHKYGQSAHQTDRTCVHGFASESYVWFCAYSCVRRHDGMWTLSGQTKCANEHCRKLQQLNELQQFIANVEHVH